VHGKATGKHSMQLLARPLAGASIKAYLLSCAAIYSLIAMCIGILVTRSIGYRFVTPYTSEF